MKMMYMSSAHLSSAHASEAYENFRTIFKKSNHMVMNVNWTYCDYFSMYTNIELLHCTPETDILLGHLCLN